MLVLGGCALTEGQQASTTSRESTEHSIADVHLFKILQSLDQVHLKQRTLGKKISVWLTSTSALYLVLQSKGEKESLELINLLFATTVLYVYILYIEKKSAEAFI